MRKPLVVLAVVLGIVVGATAGCDRREVRSLGDARLIGLVTEDGCGPLLSWLQAQATSYAGRWGAIDGGAVVAFATTSAGAADAVTSEASEAKAAAPPPAAPGAASTPAYSTTNVQEEGVDEPDLVKTNGRVLVTIAANELRVVDVGSDRPVLKASHPLLPTVAQDLLLVDDGDKVIVIGSESGVDAYRAGPRTSVTVFDVREPDSPVVESTVTMDGAYVAARLVDGVVRVVLRSSPTWMLRGFDASTIESTTIDDWLPSYTYAEPSRAGSAVDGQLVRCDAVHHPIEFSGADLVTVVAIDPDDPRPGNAASVVGAGQTVYASAERLYVSTMFGGAFTRFGPAVEVATADVDVAPLPARPTGSEPATTLPEAPPNPILPPAAPPPPPGGSTRPSGVTTQLHAFDIADEVTTRYLGSGTVDGTLLNQFSLSEYEGNLRVATTTTDPASGRTESQLVVLRLEDGSFTQIGRLAGLGRTERIYAVRFLGPTAYVVTFRQMDPLYVVDLSDPEAPALKGELKIPGYSSYLHPIGDGRLLGVGQGATDEGRPSGSQVSLFDVSDVANPRRLATFELGGFDQSDAEYDHHAFLWWPRTKLAVLPMGRGDAVGVSVGDETLAAAGKVRHPAPYPIRRSVIVGDHLLTVSDNGLLSSRLVDGLPQEAWLAF